MADSKDTKLSITLSAVDKATGTIKRLNVEVTKVTSPVGRVKQALSGLVERAGLGRIADGFRNVGSVLGTVGGVISRIGSALGDVLGKIPVLGALITGVLGAATAGMIHLVDKFDELGKKSIELGVSADWLAGMRYAAQRLGVDVGMLNVGMSMFSANVGRARAGTGRLATFLEKTGATGLKVLHDLKAAKDNAAAFDVLAAAMGRLVDPAKRAALAQLAFGNAQIAPLFAQGPEALKQLRDEYGKLAGPQAEAAKQAAETNDELARFHAAVDGIEASLVTGLGPAMTILVSQIKEWLVAHRKDLADWAAKLGKDLPGAVDKVVDAIKDAVAWLKNAYDEAKKLVDKLGSVKDLWDLVTGGASKARDVAEKAAKYSPAGLPLAAYHAATDGPTAQDVKQLKQSPFYNALPSYAKQQINAPTSQDFVNSAVQQAQAIRASMAGRPQAAVAAAGSRPDWSSFVNGAAGAAAPSSPPPPTAAPSRNEVLVKFENAPKGMRATTNPSNPDRVSLHTGYNMLPGGA